MYDLAQKSSKIGEEEVKGDGVDPMDKYLSSIIEEHSGESDRKYVMKVFDGMADGSGGADSITDSEIHGVGTLSQKKV